MKNSPSSMVKLDSRTAVKSPNSFLRSLMTICAIQSSSGKWLTMMNITVPTSVTMNE